MAASRPIQTKIFHLHSGWIEHMYQPERTPGNYRRQPRPAGALPEALRRPAAQPMNRGPVAQPPNRGPVPGGLPPYVGGGVMGGPGRHRVPVPAEKPTFKGYRNSGRRELSNIGKAVNKHHKLNPKGSQPPLSERFPEIIRGIPQRG